MLDPEWDKCACPKRCNANSLDEQWEYDHEVHVKRFAAAQFICPGCHWLKTPPWRQQTWLEELAGQLPPTNKPPHIIGCLGWTQEQVEQLRTNDLAQYSLETAQKERILKDFRARAAVVLTWTVDLSALKQYGYSEEQILMYQQRMNSAAQERVLQ